MSDSLQPHGLYSPWSSPGQNTGVGSLLLLQGIFPTQGLNQLSHKGSPKLLSFELDFPGGSASNEYACNVGDLGLIPGLGRFPGEREDYPLRYSGLENSMDCMVYGVTKSRT